MTTADTNMTDMMQVTVAGMRRKRMVGFGIVAAVLVYLTYIFFAFDIPEVISDIDGDDARILVADLSLIHI